MTFQPNLVYSFTTPANIELHTSAIDAPVIVAVHDFDTRGWVRDAGAGDAWRLALVVSRAMDAHDIITSVQHDGRDITLYFSGPSVDGAFTMTLPLEVAHMDVAPNLVSMALAELRADANSAFTRPACK